MQLRHPDTYPGGAEGKPGKRQREAVAPAAQISPYRSMVHHRFMDSVAWDERYHAEPTPWGPAPAATIRTTLRDAVPGYAIDLACGDGRHARWLRENGWDVTAVDFSPVALETARGLAYGSEIDWQCADVTSWAPVRMADLVLVGFLQIEAEELVTTLQRAIGWLSASGRLLYLGHAWENYERGVGGPPEAAVLPGVPDLARAAQGLRVDTLQHVLRDTDQGTAIDVLLDARMWSAPLPESAQPG